MHTDSDGNASRRVVWVEVNAHDGWRLHNAHGSVSSKTPMEMSYGSKRLQLTCVIAKTTTATHVTSMLAANEVQH